jgi:hypothetical protein
MGRRFTQKPITPEEIPVEYRHLFDYKSQVLIRNARNKHLDMFITVTCLDCGDTRSVMNAGIRKNIAANKFKCRCQSCAAKNRTTLPSASCRRRGPAHPGWKGEKSITRQGYVSLYSPDRGTNKTGKKINYVLEHRYVMEKHLGRRLSRVETVHHKNGVRTDNRLENLELWGSAHCHGCRYDDLSNDELTKLINELQTRLVRREHE